MLFRAEKLNVRKTLLECPSTVGSRIEVAMGDVSKRSIRTQ
ncbi:MAG TPA: hypothetical protein VF729_03465 [Solirubrobacterales bacterium]